MKMRCFVCLSFLLPACANPAWAWWVKGHGLIATAAGSQLPDDVPAFFRAAAKSLGHLAGDPDRWKNRDATHLRASEYPDHFLDMEDLKGNALPADRYQAAALLTKLGQKAERTGMLPYASMEYFDRLTCAFADYRKDPENEAVRMKCIVYAGVLSHYTGDMVMPLHTTRDYDGRRLPDGTISQRGIHAKIDGFPEKNGFAVEELNRGLQAKEIADVWKHVQKTLNDSHALVERCYELDKAGAFDKPTEQSRAFIMERCRVGAQFTMDLYYTAWKRSATFKAPY